MNILVADMSDNTGGPAFPGIAIVTTQLGEIRPHPQIAPTLAPVLQGRRSERMAPFAQS